jgi:molybdenum cofactor biosynthesis protein MoaC
LRTAKARAVLSLRPETIALIREGRVPKGDPLAVAKVAAIQAAKNTSQIIPYCHPLPVDFVGVEFEIGEGRIEIEVTVKAVHKTGVEMEALTGASVAALTLYDMLKMLDQTMEIAGVQLLEKKGGKSDFRSAFAKPLRAAVVVLSDSVAAGKKSDESGRLISDRLREEGVEVADYRIVPDDKEKIVETLIGFADRDRLDLVVTTGGTGFGPRDHTPEAMARVIEREAPGVVEAARAYGQDRTPYSMLSRGRAGVRGRTLIVNLPGSRKGAAESLDALFPALLHAFKMLRGGGHAQENREKDGEAAE